VSEITPTPAGKAEAALSAAQFQAATVLIDMMDDATPGAAFCAISTRSTGCE
jgi:hypothetical protein